MPGILCVGTDDVSSARNRCRSVPRSPAQRAGSSKEFPEEPEELNHDLIVGAGSLGLAPATL